MQIMVSEEKRAWYHFVTTLCAIIGGVFVVAGMIDSLIHGGAAVLKRKLELGASLNYLSQVHFVPRHSSALYTTWLRAYD